MRPFRIVLSLLVMTGAALFALRHHSLRQLQVEQEQLRQPSQATPTRRAASAPTEEAPVASTNAGLSASERSELLRLRGEIGGLRRELAQETNELASLSRPRGAAGPSASAEPIVSRQQMMAKMNTGKQSMLSLIMYAADHGDRFPATLAEAIPPGSQLAQETEGYELVRGGLDLKSVPAVSSTVVLREKQPWKGANGRWQRGYAFADGHVELASSDTPDFSDWEKEKEKGPENSAAAK